MPDIDLGPNDYRKQNPKTGRWHLPDDPKLCRNAFFVCVAILIAIFATRDAGSRESLFGVSVMFSWVAGIMFHGWLMDAH